VNWRSFWKGLYGASRFRLLGGAATSNHRFIPATGRADYKKSVVREAVRTGLAAITVAVALDDEELVAYLRDVLPADSRVVLSASRIEDAAAAPVVSEFKAADIRVGFEVGELDAARAAFEAGADFLVASGNEAAGPVSPKTSLVLIQELLDGLSIPVVVRGSLGPKAVAGLCAAGCAGCILDSQLLLLPESPIGEEWKRILAGASPFDTALVGTSVGRPYRLLTAGRQRQYESLLEREREIFQEGGSREDQALAFEAVLKPHLESGFSEEASLPPVGQGIAFARQFAEAGMGLCEVLEQYRVTLSESIASVKGDFPFHRDSPLAQFHRVAMPIVQGPMAVVSGTSRLAMEVAEHGALPFVAAMGMSADQFRQLMADTKAALGEKPFGVGIIAFTGEGSKVVEAVLAARPDFVTVAGGAAEQARQFDEAGIACYLHAPSLTHVQGFLDSGVRGLILEGHEAGGHVGSLGSLILWELAVQEILRRSPDSVAGTRILFAGGIGTARSSLVAAVFASALAEHGVACGLQVGTAYLTTDEAVGSKAISDSYRQALLRCSETVTTGQTVNLPARWALTPSALKLIAEELRWNAEGVPLPERKKRVERLNQEHLRAAVRGERLSAADTDGQAEPAYMCGQIISVLSHNVTMADLHEELTGKAAALARQCPLPGEAEDDLEDAIAIVGIGCIFPKANDPQHYWNNLLNRVSAIGEVPKDRWDVDLFYDPRPEVRDKSSSRLGAFIEGFKKDPVKFRIPPVAAPSIDRIQFLALEVAYQTMKDAGYLERDFPRDRTGVVLGNSMGGELGVSYGLRVFAHQYSAALESVPEFQNLPKELKDSIAAKAKEAFTKDVPEFTEDSCPGTLGSVIAGRICNYFNLGGVNFTLDGACASSLAAINAGIQGLRSGQYDMVLAGGAETKMDPPSYITFSNLGVLSETGCFPFDERADGFVMGEGVGMVLLKRWTDARRDGDKVYALIRGVGSSSDGSAKTVTAPDVAGQVSAIRRAYEGLPFTPASIALVEAHGTATRNGDLVEMTSLTEVFGRYRKKHSVALGSVKSMMGHLKTAAGIAGLIKVALALHHKVMPPTMNCEQPRRDIDWDNSPFYLITEPRPWEDEGHPRRGAVNAFGFGGVNYHMVLQEAPETASSAQVCTVAEAEGSATPAELLVFRAPTPSQVLNLVSEVEDRLAEAGQVQMRRIARELQERCRRSRGATLAVLARDVEMLRSNLQKARRALSDGPLDQYTSAQGIYYGRKPLDENEKVAFLFPGQGSQYLNMGGDLLESFPFLQSTFREVDHIARRWTGRSVLSTVFVKEDLSEGEKEKLQEEMVRTDYNHPALLAMWAGIVAFLRRAGVRPDMAAGHSVGEYGALYAAGVFDLESVVAVTTARGTKVYEHAFRAGAMAAIGAPAQQVQEVLAEVGGLVTIANKNCPAQTVISGDTEAVESVVRRFEKLGVRCSIIPVSSAFHSPLMSSCVEPFREVMENVRLKAPSIPVQCNLTGEPYALDEEFERKMRDALAQHLVRPVEFIRNVESMYGQGARLFLEVGPGSTLCSFVDNILGERPHWTFPTNLPRVSPATQLLHVLGFCAARGLHVDLDGVLLHRQRGLALRSQRRSSRPSPAPPTPPKPAQAAPDLLTEALADADGDAVKRYLRERERFLKDMVRLDFEHFQRERTPETSQPPTSSDQLDMEKAVVDLVSRKIGYPPDILDLDLDVEAELGLDSIKQAEIVRELESTLGVSMRDDPKASDLRITTLREVARRFRELVARETAGEVTEVLEEEPVPAKTTPEWNLNCHRFVSELRKRSLTQQDAPASLTGRRVLLLADTQGVGDEVALRLEKAGATVFAIPPSETHAALPDEFDLVLDLWSYGEHDQPALSECQQWWRRLESRAVALLNVAKELVRYARNRKGERLLWVEVTSLGGELAARNVESVPSMAGTGLGVSRCLFADHPDLLDVLFLDFDACTGAEFVADSILAELTHERSHNEIGYVNGKRFEIHWRVDDRQPDDDKPPLEPGSVVLAVGGARGITASICRELAQRTKAHFVLVGRSALQQEADDAGGDPITLESARRKLLEEYRTEGKSVVPAELERLAWQRVWAEERVRNVRVLRDMAQSVTYRQCDLTDPDATIELIRDVCKEYGHIDLVINGAGALVERTIEEFEPEAFVAGFKPKALGTANLLAALQDIEPGAFVNLSSVVGRWGHMGLASYAVGHVTASVLVAGMRGRRGGKWLNLLYGPWLDVGMTRQGSTIERVRDSGGAFVGERQGSQYFVAELQAETNETTTLRGHEPFGVMMAAARGNCQHPLLDYVNIVAPGVVEGGKVFDPLRDRFINEHTVLVEPILPATVAMEMMAQTASVLSDAELELTDFQDVSLTRMVRFPRMEPRQFHTRATLMSREKDGVWLSGQLFSIFRPPHGGEPQEVLHASCKMRFGVRQAPPTPSQLVVQTGLGDCPVEMKPFWETSIGAGRKGMFRNVRTVLAMTADSVCGEVMATKAGQFGKPFTDNPIRLDGLLYIATLADVAFAGHASHYIQSIESLRFFKSDDPNEARFCRAVITARTENTYTSQLEAIGSMGGVLERISGLVIRRALPEAEHYDDPIVEDMRWHPQRTEVARLLHLRTPLSLAEVRIPLVEAALEAEGEEAFLVGWLSRDEMIQFSQIRHPKRRREWLAGRIAAKEAVRSLLGAEAPPASTISILTSPDRAPYVVIDGQGRWEIPYISISHSEEYASAAATHGSSVGIDVEKGSLEVERIANQFCTPEEVNRISESTGELRVPALMTLWVVKEAALKTLGPRRYTMSDLVLENAWMDGKYTVCELRHENAGCVRAVAFRSFHYFYAVATVVQPDATGEAPGSEA